MFFVDPPLIAYRRPSNLRDKLIKASIPEPRNQRPERIISGLKECESCSIYKVEINAPVKCKSRNVVYILHL